MRLGKQRERNDFVFEKLGQYKQALANKLALKEFEKPVHKRMKPEQLLDKALFNI